MQAVITTGQFCKQLGVLDSQSLITHYFEVKQELIILKKLLTLENCLCEYISQHHINTNGTY